VLNGRVQHGAGTHSVSTPTVPLLSEDHPTELASAASHMSEELLAAVILEHVNSVPGPSIER
jgi:hypothetical protein